MSKEHLHRYCVEFAYRYNNKELSGVEKFEIALQQVLTARITYNTLVGKNLSYLFINYYGCNLAAFFITFMLIIRCGK
jgi:hypothetical protein